MLLSYLPLFFATSTYTRLGLEQLQRENAIKLGRSVSSHLVQLRKTSDAEQFLSLARTQIEIDSVHALSILDDKGPPQAVLGDPDLLTAVFDQVAFGKQAEVREISTEVGAAVLVYQPGKKGGIAAVVRVDPETTRATSLSRLMGLYMGVGALALLIAAYFALTRWIIRPILQIERGAERVAGGARSLAIIEGAPRELVNLSRSLSQMTARLRDEEQSLRNKVREVEARTVELRAAQQSLVHSERLATVGRLAAGLAHEIGNPLSAILGLQDLLKAGDLSSEEQADFLERMQKETQRIDRVLSDLLAYARPTENRSRGQTQATAVAPAIASVIDLLSPQRNLAQLSLRSELGSGLPAVSMAQEEITQVLLNLVMNAADACNRKGHVIIRARRSGDGLVLEVEDDGPGIDEKVAETLFEPFVSTKEVGKGTGLGLSVTRGLVEASGGTIRVEAVEPRGARFVIQLPLASSQRDSHHESKRV